MFKTLLQSCAAVFSILFLSAIIAVLIKGPAFIGLFLSQKMAHGCDVPSETPGNAGVLVVADVRQDGARDTLVSVSPSDWAATTTALIKSSTDPSRDLVIYAHGFGTSTADARCVGENLRVDLAQLPQYRNGAGPDIIVFSWPGEFSWYAFSGAQDSAGQAARYLSRVVDSVRSRRLYLVAHSLGAKVVMEAVSAVAKVADQSVVAGILLVEGAIPATSIRTWTGKVTLTFPAAELGALRVGKAQPRPIDHDEGGIGEYVDAAAKADHLVVTTATGDTVLRQAYSLDELFGPDGNNRPQLPPSTAEGWSQTLAIGLPFPTNPVYAHYDQVMNDPTDASKPRDNLTLRPPDPARVIQSTDWTFAFAVPHRSFHELPLDEMPTSWPYYWHAPLDDPSMRRYVLSRAWAVYFATSRRAFRPAAGTPPTRLEGCFSYPSVGDSRRAARRREPGNEIRLGYDARTQIELAARGFRSLTRPISRKL